jgi:Domain of unknown function (DUF4270)
VKRKLKRSLFPVITIILFSVACTKISTTDIGSGLIPNSDDINSRDTILDVIANNGIFPDTAIRSGVGRTGDHVLGTIFNDPLFGRSTGSMFFEMKPLGFKFYPFFNRDSIISVDSVILTLNYRNTYGDSNRPQTLRVYEINNTTNFRSDSFYLTNTSYSFFQPLSNLLATVSNVIPATLDDKRYIFKGTKIVDSVTNQLRIPLNLSNLKKFWLQDTSNTGAFGSDSLFRAYFRGFAVVTDSTNSASNGLMYFNLQDNRSNLYFYYRVKKNGVIDTTVTVFGYPSFAANANIIQRNYIPSSEIKQSLPTSPAGDSLIYIQTNPGTFADISIPALSGLSNRVVHRAELIVEEDPTPVAGPFLRQNYLFLDAFESAENRYITIPRDFQYAGPQNYNLESFGMVPDEILDNTTGQLISQWQFDVTRYVQNVLTGTEPLYRLRLYSPTATTVVYKVGNSFASVPIEVNPSIANGRVRVGGGRNARHKMRLRIIYSKL